MRAGWGLAVVLMVAGCTAVPADPVGPSVVALTDPAISSTTAIEQPNPATASGSSQSSGSAPRQQGAHPGTRLVIPSRGIDATVSRVRFRGSELGIPAVISEVGLWVDGARLNDAVGTTVLVGHVSDDHDRPGMMSRLQGVRVGATITVAPAHGAPRTFKVVNARSYDKASLPRSVFAQTGPHRLVLITCSHRVDLPGGGFHYAQNLVVTARPVRP